MFESLFVVGESVERSSFICVHGFKTDAALLSASKHACKWERWERERGKKGARKSKNSDLHHHQNDLYDAAEKELLNREKA